MNIQFFNGVISSLAAGIIIKLAIEWWKRLQKQKAEKSQKHQERVRQLVEMETEEWLHTIMDSNDRMNRTLVSMSFVLLVIINIGGMYPVVAEEPHISGLVLIAFALLSILMIGAMYQYWIDGSLKIKEARTKRNQKWNVATEDQNYTESPESALAEINKKIASLDIGSSDEELANEYRDYRMLAQEILKQGQKSSTRP